jgi:hypothetical protein
MRAFDARTIFYDCFRTDAKRLMLLAPPLTTMPSALRSLCITGLPSGQRCSFAVKHWPKLCRITVDVLESDVDLHIRSVAGEVVLRIRENQADLFRGMNVLLTVSKDNHFAWICDWMRFHRDLHGANAVLLFDNESTRYTQCDLLRAMRSVGGFSSVVVVNWPFPFGPGAFRGSRWDSNFCKGGALEDARWRFLQDANAVLNCDIDELVLPHGISIFQRVISSTSGYVSFAGRWVLPPQVTLPCGGSDSLDTQLNVPAHRESVFQARPAWRWVWFRFRDLAVCPSKWAVVPARCKSSAKWDIHAVEGMPREKPPMAQVSFRHCWQITTHWKYDRMHHKFKCTKDDRLLDAFSRVNWNR